MPIPKPFQRPPSSPTLASVIASKVDPQRPGVVDVELGAGTGAVTQALLDHGVPAGRLLAVENSPYYVELLRNRFPDVKIVQGDALQFDRLLPADMPVAAVVSGIPLLHLAPAQRRAFIERALAVQPVDGLYVAAFLWLGCRRWSRAATWPWTGRWSGAIFRRLISGPSQRRIALHARRGPPWPMPAASELARLDRRHGPVFSPALA